MKLYSSKIRRPDSPKRRSALPRLERLEDRQVLSGFGPEDGAYIVESWTGHYDDVEIQPADQKIVAAGQITGLSQYGNVAIARYDSTGNPDAGWGTGGLSTPPSPPGGAHASGLILQPDGKAVVSSHFIMPGNWYLGAGRFNGNGSLDTTFNSDGWTSTNAYPGNNQIDLDIGLQSNGNTIAAGFSYMPSTGWTAIISGFRADGALNSGKGGFGDVVKGKPSGSIVTKFGGSFAMVNSISIQPDNKIVVVSPGLVARYTANGVLDTTFNDSGYRVLTVPGVNVQGGYGALQSDGKIVFVGNTVAVDGETDMLVARLNSNGTLDTSFGGGSGYVRVDIDGSASQTSESSDAVIVQPDGKIIAVGQVLSAHITFVARLNSNGTLDSTFGAGGFKYATPGFWFDPQEVALQADGSIILAGLERTTDAHPFLMRFFGTSGGAPSGGEGGGGRIAFPDTKPLDAGQEPPRIKVADKSNRQDSAGLAEPLAPAHGEHSESLLPFAGKGPSNCDIDCLFTAFAATFEM